VLFVGRFDRHKGGDLVVQAFARLASEDPEVELVFAGPDRGLTEGDSKISLDDYIARHVPIALRPRLHVLGRTDPVRIAELRRAAQLVIVPSRYENFPMAVVEACAYGCPMVGAATGGIAEIISHERNGLLFKMGDVDELAAAIRRLLDRPAEAAAFAEAARQDYELRFKPETLAARTLDFYRSIPGCSDIGRRPK
jgi:glycosyltransferase involved in cell wall biosynthesis